VTDTRLWAVDKLILSYYAGICALIASVYPRLPEAPWLLAAHTAAAAILWIEIKRPNRTTWVFRHWYPLPYVTACYREAAILIPAIGTWNADRWLAGLDYRIWGAHPTVWMERISFPVLTEFLQVIYTLFVPAVLLVPVLIWRERRYADFRYCAFLIAFGFLVSYVSYFLVPARGPRFLLRSLQHTRLAGLWLFQSMQSTLDRLESAHYDCFPSGHTELTMIALWASRLVSKRLFRLYLAYTLCIIFATVYLRYHYTVDVLAGAVIAAAVIVVSPVLYRKLSTRGSEFGGN